MQNTEPKSSSTRNWWYLWGGLALASAALESLPEFASSLRGDPTIRVAYLDPGAGSFVIQALVAALAGIAVTTKVYWHRIKGFIGTATPGDEDDDAEDRDDA